MSRGSGLHAPTRGGGFAPERAGDFAKRQKVFAGPVVSGLERLLEHGTACGVAMAGKVPKALIVRFNASENPEDSNKITSYLAVAKISSSGACLVARIRPSANMNLEARRVSDRAAGMSCLK